LALAVIFSVTFGLETTKRAIDWQCPLNASKTFEIRMEPDSETLNKYNMQRFSRS
jgi:hypothetical protein